MSRELRKSYLHLHHLMAEDRTEESIALKESESISMLSQIDGTDDT